MNLFERGRAGIRICISIALKHDARISLHIDTIAAQAGREVKEARKMCEDLVEAGYFLRDPNSARSYRLALPPDLIKLGDIIRICEPDFHLTDCKQARTCPVNQHCFYDQRLWGNLEDQIFNMLNQVTIQDYINNMIEMSYVAPATCQLSQLKDD